ncbi:MAG: hypothetical protein HUJ26_22525 [Planctomycetaceae bacterium]|nr:hypothetical protein [Planctomycetaceae bacterium]
MKINMLLMIILAVVAGTPESCFAEFRAGAAIVDVTPSKFPVFVNGGMRSRSADQVTTPVNARAIVVDDGNERVAIVVVDSCMMPRPLLDDAKALAATRTKISPDHMLISATHTHSAPASMGCLGTDADPNYVPYLRDKLAEAIATAEANLEPAEIGWGSIDAPDYTALRRWILRPDRLRDDPFGNPTVRANMHAGRNWDDVVGESGPEDPELALVALRAKGGGRPIALLANFSMHYFSGPKPLSADYFGEFCNELQTRIAGKPGEGRAPFVAAMSHGCSGDIWRKDYKNTEPNEVEQFQMEQYASGLADYAIQAYETIQYQSDVPVRMAETRMELNYRVPDKQLLLWSQKIVEEMGDRLPETQEEIYAREQVILHERQSTEIVVQGLQLGNIGIASTPNETYALTGLKVKLQSPLPHTMVIELANGGDGYIPPPEQHMLGGYNTWAARSAGLEETAEPKIAETALELLEKVTGQARHSFVQTRGPVANNLLSAQPSAYWRLDEMQGLRAKDSSPQHNDAILEPPVAFFLSGPASDKYCQDEELNRSIHFAGGRLSARLPEIENDYTIVFWCWNGMPTAARPVTGWMFGRGQNWGVDRYSEFLGLGGLENHPGQLIYQTGDGVKKIGKTVLDRWTWYQVALVRKGDHVDVYLNGNSEPEISVEDSGNFPSDYAQFYFGGRSDGTDNWEGRLDEIAVFPRALSSEELKPLME